ncbi:hypothetical protein [Musicola paradisiaca]|uniref:HEPN domain-containing protein n=1 Tax=Musicola paradisiaca (strain Ech703) TaxID=579405 RepID=C6C9W9_MUSP7|nr:hypothetical protein [Musicola paradisiaca]ACS86391.1 hypothetical protein Dd703_2614 [Musicola paradisiaca Ech703]
MSTLLFETDEQRFARCRQHARGYHRRAQLLAGQSQSVSLIFNVAAIAVECYLIALCALHGVMPLNHNYRNLLASAMEKTRIDNALQQSILSLDAIFGICAVDDYHHGTPGSADKARILAICDDLDALIERDIQHRETPS